jgi:DNA (cytosine-5)-methyltransferase 1
VFVVASAREGFNPTEVLFEFNGVRRDSAPSRKEGKEIANTAGESFTASSFAGYREGVGTLRSSGGDLGGGSETLAVIPFNKQRIGQYSEEDIASTCAARDYKDATDLVCYALQGNMIGRSDNAGTQGSGVNEELRFTQTKTDTHAVAYGIPGNWIGRKPENGGNAVEPMHDIAPCQTNTDVHAVASGMQVRRLTPVECERLQGFPDNYTDIRPNGRLTPDGPRYKALGNSWAIPVVRWIGMRIKDSLN